MISKRENNSNDECGNKRSRSGDNIEDAINKNIILIGNPGVGKINDFEWINQQN